MPSPPRKATAKRAKAAPERPAKRAYEQGKTAVTVWFPDGLLGQLDAELERLAVASPGGKFSRQSWILSKVAAALGKS